MVFQSLDVTYWLLALTNEDLTHGHISLLPNEDVLIWGSFYDCLCDFSYCYLHYLVLPLRGQDLWTPHLES